jgi:predicted ATPase
MTLPLREIEIEGYRSIRSITYPVSDLDVLVGANGVGKTNLYRALELLQAAATNTLARDLMAEGGLASAFWAGAWPRKKPQRLRFAVGLGDPSVRRPGVIHRYEIEIGRPPAEASASFQAEPQIKAETLTYHGGSRPVVMVERRGRSVMARGESGRPEEIDIDLLDSETVFGRLEEPSRFPALDAVRRTLLQWRFYHDLRTDPGSPMRRPAPAIATPTMASDGADLAAVFATLEHVRQDTEELRAAVQLAFPGADLEIPEPDALTTFGMRFPEFPRRVFGQSELSDGTLRFLGLLGALMSYRLPPFIALNEPEASLHPSLTEPLGRIIAAAAERTQIWLVTHSPALAEATSGAVRRVVKSGGATQIEGLKAWGAFSDEDD